MYKLFNTHTRETSDYQFLDYDNARDEAYFWSKNGVGTIAIIKVETGIIMSLWADGECVYDIL